MSGLEGTGLLVRGALRRDRVLVGVWLAVLTATVLASAGATDSLYPTAAERTAAAESINATPATVALYGPILDVHSRGELAMTKLTVLYAVLVALLLVVLVRRHTRTDEESGHAELLGGTAVGRQALLAAAVAEGVAVSVAVGVLAALAAVVGGLPVTGSLAFAATWTGTGLVAVGLTAVACQLSASSRTCMQAALATLAVLYAVRAVADVGPTRLGWLSPLGWSTRLCAWSGPRWWVLLLYVGLAAGLVALAGLLRSRRDLGSGLVAARPGPAVGGPRLATALALGWRVNRAAARTWTAGALLMGGAMGAIAPGIGSLLDTDTGRDLIRRLGGTGALEDALVGAVLSIAAVVVTCFAVSVVAHAGSDEAVGRTEQVLATGVARSGVFAATAVLALLGTAWLLLVTGAAIAVGLKAAGEGAVPLRVVGSALDQVPAVWVVVALTLLLHGVRRGWAVAGWGVVAGCAVVGQLGELLRLPRAVTGLSPYSHLPAMPVEAFAPVPVLVLSALTALLLGAAWWRFTSRGIG